MINKDAIIDLKIENIEDATEEQKEQKLSKKEKAVISILTTGYILGIGSVIFGTKATVDYNQKLIDDYKNDMYARQEQLMHEFEMEHPAIVDFEESYDHVGKQDDMEYNSKYNDSASVLDSIDSVYTIADYNDIYKTAYDAINMINAIPKGDLVIDSFKDATYGDYYKADSKITYDEAVSIATSGNNIARSIINDGQVIGYITEEPHYLIGDVSIEPKEDLGFDQEEQRPRETNPLISDEYQQQPQYNQENVDLASTDPMAFDTGRGYY